MPAVSPEMQGKGPCSIFIIAACVGTANAVRFPVQEQVPVCAACAIGITSPAFFCVGGCCCGDRCGSTAAFTHTHVSLALDYKFFFFFNNLYTNHILILSLIGLFGKRVLFSDF